MKILFAIILNILILISNSYSQWVESSTPYQNGITDICFINTNTGYASTSEINNSNKNYLLKTTNKGLNWTYVYEFLGVDFKSSIDFINESTGFFSTNYKVFKTTNGGANWDEKFSFGAYNRYPRIKFGNASTGYASYSKFYTGVSGTGGIYLYRTTDGGDSWNITTINGYFTVTESRISDIFVSKSDANIVAICGFRIENLNYTSVYSGSNNGFGQGDVFEVSVEGARFDRLTITPVNNEVFILSNKGIFKENTNIVSLNESSGSEQAGISIDINGKGYAITNGGKIYKSTNNGQNWSFETTYSTSQVSDSRVINYNDIVYSGMNSGKILTKTLYSNLNTYLDNQSTSGSLSFDWINYSTPTSEYLRGGYSSLNCSDLINSGQTNERIFYRWSDGFMKARHSIDSSNGKDFYFDMSGTTIANYYKTKQISSTAEAISTIGQTKVLKDDWGAINQIHQSMNGGIFYTKSYNNGTTYKREEIVNSTTTHSIPDGNKNPALYETKWYGGLPSSGYPVNKNMSACWERYNSSTGMTEIKVAVRDYNYYGPPIDTIYSWNSWTDTDYTSDVFTSFSSASNYNAKPKIFALSMNTSLFGSPGEYFFMIPHLRPYSGGNKLQVSCRKGSTTYAEFPLDSGDITDFSAIDSIKCGGGYLEINFAYRKGNQIIYRNTGFEYNSGLPIAKYNLEGPIDVSSGDGGFASRLTPDISLMDNIPVITYAANYNAWRTIEYEDQSTGSIQVSRYPIVKVQKTPTGWNNFVIYNSGNIQSKPDIEGSKNTSSYILNYSIGNGSFKKIVNISGYPGTICQPNIFSGTDSRLVNNSFTSSFGSNLSLLTLSPQSGLYKLDKQNFILSNITAENFYDVDNLDGVVDLDTISYSFKVGPIYTQSFYENYYEIEGVGVIGPSYEEPVIGGIEFNENLKSYPFLLNETQALLIGSNATYVKDNNHYSISEIPYTVNLYNKTTGLLHRTLFQDTIKPQDSVETESLRGYYITDIPNGVDSFYVKLEVNDEFENADYFINPIYEDDEYGPTEDNLNEGKIAIIYENNSLPSVVNNIIPTEYSLSQNYPNPFNPTTTISYDIPNDGIVKIKIFDLTGREIQALVNEMKQAGKYRIKFDGSNLASGVYFYKIEAGSFVLTRRMLLIK